MISIKKHTWSLVVIVVCLALISGCGVGNSEDESSQGAHEHGNDGQQGDIMSFTHIHGLAYEQSEPYDLFLATHYGLFRIGDNEEVEWLSEEGEQHDFMGFAVVNETTFISSGHPDPRSSLQNPLGVMMSHDRGLTWKTVALEGVVDFHLLAVQAQNSQIIYGLNTFGEEKGLYLSKDGGASWEKLVAEGLPPDLNTVFSLVIHPTDEKQLLMGTQFGILASSNAGLTWSMINTSYTMTGAQAFVQPSQGMYAYLIGEKKGLHVSYDFGKRWNSIPISLAENDLVTYITVHPKNKQVMTVGTIQQTILTTEDSGESWRVIAEAGLFR